MGFVSLLRSFVERFIKIAPVYELVCTSVKDSNIKSDLEFQIVRASPEELAFLKTKVPKYISEKIDLGISRDCIFNIAKGKEIYGFCSMERDLNKKTAHSLGSFVFPEYRGQNIFQKLKQHSCRELLEQGFTEVTSHVSWSNKASQKGQINVGFVPRYSFIILNVLGRDFWLFKKSINTIPSLEKER